MINFRLFKIFLLTNIGLIILVSNLAISQSVIWNSYYRGQNSNTDWGGRVKVDDSGFVYITGTIDWGPSGCATIKYAPNGDSVWTRVLYNGAGTGNLLLDKSGNVYIGGSMTLIKYDKKGVIQWIRKDSLNNWHISTAAMQFDSSGNIITSGLADFKGGKACVVSKFEPQNGNLIWRGLIPILNGKVFAMSIDKNQNILVCGTRGNNNIPSYYDYFVIKFDNAGNFIWEMNYTSTGQFTTDWAYDVTTDDSCNVYVTGVGDPGGPSEIVTIKYDSSGTQKWLKTFTGATGSRVMLDEMNNVIVAGYSNSNYIVVKYRNDGTELWSKIIPVNGWASDPAATLDSAGSIYIGGSKGRGAWSDLQIIKYNSNGILQWQLTYPGSGNTSQIPYDIIVDKDGIVYTTGSGSGLGGGTGVKMSTFKISQVTGINIISSYIPEKFSLSQNYPNPFNPTTKINFSLPKEEFVSLKVYDMLGREVSNLVNEKLNAGEYSYDFDGSSLQSGTFFYRLQSENFSDTKKMILIK